MGKVLRKIGIFTAVVALFLIGTYGWFIFVNMAETKKMHPLQTQEVVSGIYAINNDFVNFFLVKGPEGYIAVDSGINPNKSKSELRRLGINPNQVKAVLLTHTDYDHTAGLGLFPHAVVFISTAEEQMVNGKTHRRFIFDNKLQREDRQLADRQRIKLAGLDVEGILTPGHTPGSMCYQINGKYLFVGDSMSVKNGKAALFNDFYNMDSKLQKRSLTIIAKVNGVQDLFTAHYGFSKDEPSLFTKE